MASKNDLERFRQRVDELEMENEQLKKRLQECEFPFRNISHAPSNPIIITVPGEGHGIDLNNASLDVRNCKCDRAISIDSVALNDYPLLQGLSTALPENKAEVLKKSEEKYRMLVENSLQGLAIMQDGQFVFCNDRLAEITRFSVEERHHDKMPISSAVICGSKPPLGNRPFCF
jgi:PAS domain-containing protein